jgi:hypothetical protein
MVHQFQQIITEGGLPDSRAKPGLSTLVIPRLNKRKAAQFTSSITPSLTLQYFSGPTKPIPPAFPINCGLDLQELSERNAQRSQA